MLSFISGGGNIAAFFDSASGSTSYRCSFSLSQYFMLSAMRYLSLPQYFLKNHKAQLGFGYLEIYVFGKADNIPGIYYGKADKYFDYPDIVAILDLDFLK